MQESPSALARHGATVTGLSNAEAIDTGAEVVPLVLPSGAASASESGAKSELAPRTRPTLYHFPVSLPSQQVRLALAEKHVEWDGRIVNTGPANEHLEPWYAKLNPRLDVPTLEVAGEVLTNPVDIVVHIDEHFHGPALIPKDPEQRAEVLRWIEIQADFPLRELVYARTKGMLRWFQRWSMSLTRRRLRKLIRKQPHLREVYEAKQRDLEALEKGVRHRVAMTELVDDVELLLDEIEQSLEQHKWLAGECYTLADTVWTAVLSRLEQIGFARSLRSHRRPHVADWYARLRERPSWDAMIRRLSFSQAARFYGPAVAKTFVLAWVLKWAIVLGIGWLVAHFG